MGNTEEDPRVEARVLYAIHGAGETPVRAWHAEAEAIRDAVSSLGRLCDVGWAKEDDGAYLVLAELTEADLWRCREVALALADELEGASGWHVTFKRVDLGTLTVERAEAEEGS